MTFNSLFEYFPNLMSVYLACLVAFTSPGPNFVAVTSHAVESRKSGLGIATGISLGTALWALLAATGITALLTAYHHAALMVGLAGGSYLCWLGFKSIRSVIQGAKFNASLKSVSGSISALSSMRTGLLIQMTNPKTAVFWLAVTSLAIQPETPAEIVALLVIGCLIIALIWHSLLALAFSSGPIRDGYVRFKPVISTVFGVLFICLGLRIVYSVSVQYFPV